MYKPHTHCRACGYAEAQGPPGIKSAPSGEKLIPVFNLGVQPLANDFCREGEERAGWAPLEVLFCPRCTLAQLSVVVDPRVLYRRYAYVTSKSDTMQGHFQLLWQFINLEVNPESVVEIGSNDGDFLQFAKDHGATAVCGIDPAENLAETANKRGLTTLCSLLDRQSADMASAAMPPINVIVARHVFCHVDDWRQFLLDVDRMCRPETIVVIEVPRARDLLDKLEFDTIYHEHLSYFTLRSLDRLLESTPLRLHRVQRFPVHGGSVAVMLRRRDHPSQMLEECQTQLKNENVTQADWDHFRCSAGATLSELRDAVFEARHAGKTVVGFGASAKSTVWVNAAGFTRQELKFICDSTPHKWHTTSPGSDIPIVDEGALLREQPDLAVCFAWNFRKEILEKQQLWRSQGGRFLFPFPKLEIV